MTPRHELPTPGPAAMMSENLRAMVPVLTTKRLTLRAPCLTDFDGYAEIVCTERGIHVGGPFSREDGWFDYLTLSSGWMLHGHGGWSVEETATGKLAGFVVLGLEPGDGEVELGFLLRPWAEGRGYAFEAATAARDYAWDTLDLGTLVSYIDARNTRSIRLAKRLGATDATPPGHDDPDTRIFAHYPGRGPLQ